MEERQDTATSILQTSYPAVDNFETCTSSGVVMHTNFAHPIFQTFPGEWIALDQVRSGLVRKARFAFQS